MRWNLSLFLFFTLLGSLSAAVETCQYIKDRTYTWPTTEEYHFANGTCTVGFYGSPYRYCGYQGIWEDKIYNPCSIYHCPAIVVNDLSFEETEAFATAKTHCPLGYSGTVSRKCNETGFWSPTITYNCTRNICPETDEWIQTESMNNQTSSCRDIRYEGIPWRYCHPNGTWGPIHDECQIKKCPPITAENADWPETDCGSDMVYGTCHAGYIGRPWQDCLIEAIWGGYVFDPCEPDPGYAVCLGMYDGLSYWPESNGSTLVTGECIEGTRGSVTRFCNAAGEWEAINGTCTVNICPGESSGNATWPTSSAGRTVKGNCSEGFTGSPWRTCQGDGTWGPIFPQCTRIPRCDSITEGNASWPQTAPNTVVNGTCLPFFIGSPTRACNASGFFEPIAKPCIPMCPHAIYGHATWNYTLPKTLGRGTCLLGWAGTPTRNCNANGVWATNNITYCKRLQCPAHFNNGVSYPATNTEAWATGVCPPGTSGIARRYCNVDQTWSLNPVERCKPI